LREEKGRVPKQTANTGNGRHLQLLIDAVIDYAIYMIGVDGRILSWNSGAARLKGSPPKRSSASRSPAFTPPRTGLPAFRKRR
jgi:PAS domain-containing protein